MRVLKETLPDPGKMAYIHRLHDVLFSHGGLADVFVQKYISSKDHNNVDKVVDTINGFDWGIM